MNNIETKSSKKSKRWRMGLMIPIFLLVGVIAFLAYWTLPPGERALARILESRIGKSLDADVRIFRLKTNLIFSDERLHKVILSRPSGFPCRSGFMREVPIPFGDINISVLARWMRMVSSQADWHIGSGIRLSCDAIYTR